MVTILKSEKNLELERSSPRGRASDVLRSAKDRPFAERKATNRQTFPHLAARSLTVLKVLTQRSKKHRDTRCKVNEVHDLHRAIPGPGLVSTSERLTLLNPEPRTHLRHLICPIPK